MGGIETGRGERPLAPTTWDPDIGVGLASWLTIERVAYAAVALLALGIRLWGLGWWPLGPAEASQALPAWAAARGLPYDLAGVSPLLFSLQRLAFVAFGASDALARWWPAVIGGLTTLLFRPLRPRLTAGGALAAAFLWAVSPLAVFTSRQATDQALVAPLALAVLAAVSQIGQGRQAAVAAAISLGLLLAAGPGAYTVILIGLIVALVWRSELAAFAETHKVAWRQAALAGVLALALSATFFLTAPAGLAAAADLLGGWLRAVRPGAGAYGAWDILRRLLMSEPLLLGFGLAGGIAAFRQQNAFGKFGVLAVGLALLAPVVGTGRQPTDLALVVLALTLLAGPAVAWVLAAASSWRDDVDSWLLVGLSLALLTSAALSLSSLVMATASNNQITYAGVGIATVALTIALWIIYGIFGSWRTVAAGLPAVLLTLGLAWGLGQVSSLSYDRDPGRQAAALIETPDPNWQEFREELGRLAAYRGGGIREGRLDVILPGRDPLLPMLRWELRSFSAVRVAASLPSDPAPVVITTAEQGAETKLGNRYAGAEFALLRRWRPESLTDAKSWIRWILYREAKTAPTPRKVVLWADWTSK